MKSFLHKIILPAVLLLGTHAGAQTVRDITDEAMNPNTSLIMPHSAETNTRQMLEQWYLKNYAVLDTEADSRPDPEVSDEVLIERLSALPTVIEMPLNGPVRNAIKFYARKKQLVENMLGLSIYYMPIFEEALERHGLPRELRYLPVIESALVPTAKSPAGAGGLWQFMPATGRGLGLEQNSLVDMRFDPYASSEAGALYLKQLYETFGDWSLAIAAYNCGPGNVNKALRRAGEGKHDFWEIYPFLPAETRGYFPAFIAANYIMTYHKDHNISPALARRPIVVDTVHVTRRVHFQQISDVMDIPVSALRALNPQYRTDLIPGDLTPCPLVLPSLQTLAYVANEDSIVNHNASAYARRGYVEPASNARVGRDANGEYYDEETTHWHTVRRGETLSSIARRYGTTVSEIRRYNRVGKSVKSGKKLKIVTTTRRYRPSTPPATVEPADTVINVAEENVPASADTTALSENRLPVEPTVCPEEEPVAVDTDSVADAADQARVVAEAFNSGSHPALPEPQQTREQAPAPVQSRQQSNNNSQAQTRTQNTRNSGNSQNNRPRSQGIRHKVRRGDSLNKLARRYGVTVGAIKRANNLTNDNIQIGQVLIIPQ